mgnify:CR=1 FL=1
MANLGFGIHFAPWMTQRRWSATGGWGPLEVIPLQPLQLHPAAGVLQYAQTIFEGMKAFAQVNGGVKVFRPDFHERRLRHSAHRVCLPELPEGGWSEALMQTIRANAESIPRGDGEALYLRPTLLSTEGFLGVRPARECLFYVIASPVGSYFNPGRTGLRIMVETRFSRAAAGGIGSAQAGANYAASLYSAEQARQKGFDQVLWTDAATHSMVEEVGTMNVFFKIGEQLITPSLGDTILGGSTRDAALYLLKSWGMEVVERPLSLEEIASGAVSECFGVGTAAVVSKIQELADIDGNVFLHLEGETPVADRLKQAILDIQYGRAPDPKGWMVDCQLPQKDLVG